MMPRKTQQKPSRYCWLLPSHGNSLVLCVVSDTIVLSFSCLCSPIMPLARSWEVSPLLLWQSVVQYNFTFFPTTFLSHFFVFVFVFCFSLHDACQSLHEITGMLQMVRAITTFLLTFKMYLIITPRKQF